MENLVGFVRFVKILTMKVISIKLVRLKCNRCGKPQSNENDISQYEDKNSETNNIMSPTTTNESDIDQNNSNSGEKKKKKPFVERVGDWICIKCKNLNFSFRMICNRCQLSKSESENYSNSI